MSNNPELSCGKSLFDLFNMVNPNCYQAMIIQDIISNNTSDAIDHCKALQIAIEYYKWETKDKNTDYIDSLICQSGLDKWQKIAIMHILGSNIKKCIECLEYELTKSELTRQNNLNIEYNRDDPFYKDRLLHESIMKMLHPSNTYPYWTTIPRLL